jgi:LmbE family N-acetylglucosaminyl deacetylase
MKIFLFAHQDDEIFALPYILNSEKKIFIYLTNGVSASSTETELLNRSIEASEVFERHLAGLNSEVVWWGLETSIPEGALYKFVNYENISSIVKIIKQFDSENLQLITTTFEGAHQDHDACAVIARELGKSLGIEVIEISTYPQWLSRIYSFKVMKPRHRKMNLDFQRGKTVLLAIKLIKDYRTQRLTWVGLGISTLIVYAFRKYNSAVPIKVGRLSHCFYEFRGR